MTPAARQYVTDRGIVRREPIYSASRFDRLVGNIPPANVTAEHLAKYRQKCVALGLSARTIESSVSDLLTVITAMTGRTLSAGKRLPVPRPTPAPASFESINAVWPHAEQWLRQWIAIAYWTGLRLTDTMTLQVQLQSGITGDVIHFSASKTGTQHVFPVVRWFADLMAPTELPFTASTDFSRKRLRAAIAEACAEAGVAVWLPKHLRQRSLTEWSRTGMAGALIHGSGLRVLNHYVDPLAIIEAAAHRVRLPECFGASQSDAAAMLSAYNRTDPAGQRLLRETAQRLATG